MICVVQRQAKTLETYKAQSISVDYVVGWDAREMDGEWWRAGRLVPYMRNDAYASNSAGNGYTEDVDVGSP
jgi:hypothetical protein